MMEPEAATVTEQPAKRGPGRPLGSKIKHRRRPRRADEKFAKAAPPTAIKQPTVTADEAESRRVRAIVDCFNMSEDWVRESLAKGWQVREEWDGRLSFGPANGPERPRPPPQLTLGEARNRLINAAREAGRPASIRSYAEIYVRHASPGIVSFDIPAFSGMFNECRQFARDRALETGLPIVEIPYVNPNLRVAEFERPAIYLAQVVFDEMDPRETRCFRLF
jgi:hypothetical protein